MREHYSGLPAVRTNHRVEPGSILRRHYTFHTCGRLAALVLIAGASPLWSASYGQLPLTFEANAGQTDARVLYLARGQGYGLFLSRNSATLRLVAKSRVAEVRMNLSSAADPMVEGIGPLAAATHYYRGKEQHRWIGEVPSFARVRYSGVYSGVDLVFYGNQRSLEYDFVVAPGANPDTIAMAFDGASHIRIDPSGDLLLDVSGGEIRLLKPVAYQEIAGVRRPVTARYHLRNNGVGFALGSYDTSRPLIIDPILNYSSYLGGSGLDGAAAIAVDALGNAYIAGWTTSANFPSTTGAYQPSLAGMTDAFVAKIDPLGQTLLFSTFLGGSAYDTAEGIAADAEGNVYVVGSTQSTDFPTLNLLQSYGGNGDGFIAKLTSSGTLTYSTYLGGSAADDAHAISVDALGNAYVAGITASNNFPVTARVYQTLLAGASDAFVLKLNATGSSAIYSTYLGGSGTDEANGIAVDDAGNAWVGGSTWSSAFPTQNPLQSYGGSEDGFVTKLNSSGTGLLFSTFLGGSSADLVKALAADRNGNAYVAGSTGSVDFPVTAGVVQTLQGGFSPDEDAFVVKYNSDGTQVMYSTYLGGAGDDIAYGIAVDAQGYAYVAGETASSNFPVLNSLQSYSAGNDVFVTVLNAGGTALVFSTFLGNSGNDSAKAIATDTNGRIYAAGETSSTNLPISPANRALQAAAGGSIENAFVAAIQFCTCGVSVSGSPFSASGGTGSLTISAAASCPWSATSSVPWITLAPPVSGSGNGTIGLAVAANTGGQTRTGVLTAGWQSVQVTQSSLCDLQHDGTTDVTDVQLVINEALGITRAVDDMNQDGVVNLIDVQIEIDASLQLGCPAATVAASRNKLRQIPRRICEGTRPRARRFGPASCTGRAERNEAG